MHVRNFRSIAELFCYHLFLCSMDFLVIYISKSEKNTVSKEEIRKKYTANEERENFLDLLCRIFFPLVLGKRANCRSACGF